MHWKKRIEREFRQNREVFRIGHETLILTNSIDALLFERHMVIYGGHRFWQVVDSDAGTGIMWIRGPERYRGGNVWPGRT